MAVTAACGASALPRCAAFLHRPGRSKRVEEEVLGDEFEGVLVSDFYGAYNVCQGPHQRCWTHVTVQSCGDEMAESRWRWCSRGMLELW